MKEIDNQRLHCPWLKDCSNTAYAAESIANLLDGDSGFSSLLVRRLFHMRSGMTFFNPRGNANIQSDDAKLIGSILHKISQRGLPAPCSLKVERYVLNQAKEAGVLDFEESTEGGRIKFVITNKKIANLDLMVQACCISEFLLDDNEVDQLLGEYKKLCTIPERRFFEELHKRLYNKYHDKRLALLITPQRQMNSMVDFSLESASLVDPYDIVDFAIEVPSLLKERDTWLKIAIEVDDRSHINSQERDENRKKLLINAGWAVYRYLANGNNWHNMGVEIVNEIASVIPQELLIAAKELRSLSTKERQAIQSLVFLPLAESQIMTALAKYIYNNNTANVSIADTQGLGLHLVLETITDMLNTLSTLHEIKNLGYPRIPQEGEKPEIQYYAIPSVDVWDAIGNYNSIVIAPRIVSPHLIAPRKSMAGNLEPLLPAMPHPINTGPLYQNTPKKQALQFLLENIFRLMEFRPSQIEIIDRAISLKPVIGLLPTGAGKSLCYQLAAFTQPGISLVIDPLVSLMQDQQQNLALIGIHRSTQIKFGKDSDATMDRIIRDWDYNMIKRDYPIFIFISPERLQMKNFKNSLKLNVPISYCIIDEAHCISEWGHDFRPSYLNIHRRVNTYCKYNGQGPAFMALTGTASLNVLTDVKLELDVTDSDALIKPESFDRKELNFKIVKVKPSDRLDELINQIKETIKWSHEKFRKSKSLPNGLIFTNFVNKGIVGAVELRKVISSSLCSNPDYLNYYNRIEYYTGSLPKNSNLTELQWSERKCEIQDLFKRNEINLLVCTSSFGMGIDKPDIRFTIHSMLPKSIEEFYQQCGRAGRDRNDALCILLFSDEQEALSDELLDTEKTKVEELGQKKSSFHRLAGGSDIFNNTYFLTTNFLGREKEKTFLKKVLKEYIVPNLSEEELVIPFSALEDAIRQDITDIRNIEQIATNALEKTIYRLMLIDVIDDYMKDYTKDEFAILIKYSKANDLQEAIKKHLRKYFPDGEVKTSLINYIEKSSNLENLENSFGNDALKYGCALIEFIYDKIEKRRREALRYILNIARIGHAKGENQFRIEILNFLEESKFSKEIRKLTGGQTESKPSEYPEDWLDTISHVEGKDDINKLLGACRRELSENPDLLGVRLMAGLCLAVSGDIEQGLRDLSRAFRSLRERYPDDKYRLSLAKQILFQTKRLDPSCISTIAGIIIESDESLDLTRLCYTQVETNSIAHHLAISRLLQNVIQQIELHESSSEDISYSVRLERIRSKYPKAYEKWYQNDDFILEQEFYQGTNIAELSRIFQRQPSAIKARLKKLGLI